MAQLILRGEKVEDNINMKYKPKVFLSYETSDRHVALAIEQKLSDKGIHVWVDVNEIRIGDSFIEIINNAINTSDFLIFLLSPNSINSKWHNNLFNYVLNNTRLRNIALIPVLIEDCQLPLELSTLQYIDLRRDFDKGVNKLAGEIYQNHLIDFKKLNYKQFEFLITDLLLKLGFFELHDEKTIIKSNRELPYEADIIANYLCRDPFGLATKETWIVEVKLYHSSRADLKTLHQLVTYLSEYKGNSKGLLITNGQITSAAYDWLKSSPYKKRIRIIEGMELKRLILQHEDLVYKYFYNVEGNDE